MNDRWAVAITQPQRESKALLHATQNGFQCYLPKLRTQHRVEALFPRYLFVVCNGAWRKLFNTIGISGVVTHAERPALLQNEVIKDLRKRCDKDDFYVEPENPFALRRGMRVRVKCGVWMGQTGVITRMRAKERVDVLMTVLGKVNVFEGDLELIN